MKIEYLLFDLFILVFSWIGALSYPKKRLPRVRPMVVATALVALFFIIWDWVVTGWWWRFNPAYTLGIFIGNLPLEEVLFFLIIPSSCLLIWVNLRTHIEGAWKLPVEKWVGIGLLLLTIVSITQEWWYTMSVCSLGAGLCVWSVRTNQFLHKRSVSVWLMLVVVLTLIFNGYLTWRPVVLYEASVKSGVMIGTIPVEDVLYGLILVAAVGMIYERYESSGNRGGR